MASGSCNPCRELRVRSLSPSFDKTLKRKFACSGEPVSKFSKRILAEIMEEYPSYMKEPHEEIADKPTPENELRIRSVPANLRRQVENVCCYLKVEISDFLKIKFADKAILMPERPNIITD